MKRIFLILSVIILFLHTNAQKPEPVYGRAREHRTVEWYKQQSKAWQKVTDADPKNAEAWYNYYKANRNLIFSDTTDNRSDNEKDAFMQNIVDRMGEKIPGSYEYYFCKWQVGGNDMKYYSFLEKAIAIDPNRTEHVDYMINIGELQRDINQRNTYSLKKFNIGEFSTGLMYYNYNVISGLEPNAILLTGGDNDTYPAWALQAMGTRKDVKIINLYLIMIDDYREKIFRELGLENVTLKTEADKKEFRNNIIKIFSRNKKNYPVYITLTSLGCEDYAKTIQNDLYLTGLAYQYSSESFDNIAVLKRNIEKLYALDYIDKPFYKELSEERVRDVNRNYLVPMMKLYTHYKNSGDVQRQSWIREKIITISKGTEDEESTLQYVEKD